MLTREEMQKKVDLLNYWTEQYDKGTPVVSDVEWDAEYYSLVEAEKETGIVLANSPTQKVNYTVVNELVKVEHSHPMLSMAKTKSDKDIKTFIDKGASISKTIVMCKMDGLTCSLTYKHGKLIRAETRGDGEIGEDITHNAFVIDSIPKDFATDIDLVIDGEIICKEADFEPFKEEYKNARNFASGSIRLLDSSICKSRQLTFVAWDLISTNIAEYHTLSDKLNMLMLLGFTVVPYKLISCGEEFDASVTATVTMAKDKGYPIDGVVFKYDNTTYYGSLGATSHHYKGALAYKLYDDLYDTQLDHIEWSMSKTGELTPIAVFDSVDIDGSNVSKASLHNINTMQKLLHGNGWKGQPLKVYKANMIIPQVYNASEPGDGVSEFNIPDVCPHCGKPLFINEAPSGTKKIVCVNNKCPRRVMFQIAHYCSKDGLDIKGVSEATVETLMSHNRLSSIADLYTLTVDSFNGVEGFTPNGAKKLINSIQKSVNAPFEKFIVAISIPTIGKVQAKEIIKVCSSFSDLLNKVQSNFDWTILDGFANTKSYAINNFDYSDAIEAAYYVYSVKF